MAGEGTLVYTNNNKTILGMQPYPPKIFLKKGFPHFNGNWEWVNAPQDRRPSPNMQRKTLLGGGKEGSHGHVRASRNRTDYEGGRRVVVCYTHHQWRDLLRYYNYKICYEFNIILNSI